MDDIVICIPPDRFSGFCCSFSLGKIVFAFWYKCIFLIFGYCRIYSQGSLHHIHKFPYLQQERETSYKLQTLSCMSEHLLLRFVLFQCLDLFWIVILVVLSYVAGLFFASFKYIFVCLFLPKNSMCYGCMHQLLFPVSALIIEIIWIHIAKKIMRAL